MKGTVTTPSPDLDSWIASPAVRVAHRRPSAAPPERLWDCAQNVRLCDTGLLGRLIRWRLPGTPLDLPFGQLFRTPPFVVLEEDHEHALLSGIVGRIWTLRRDYPRLARPEDFREWSQSGTARVLFAHWIEPVEDGARFALHGSDHHIKVVETLTRIDPNWSGYVTLGQPEAQER